MGAVATIVALGSAVFGGIQNADAQGQQQKTLDNMQSQQDQQIKQAQDQATNAQNVNQNNQVRDQQLQRIQALQALTQGNGGTILTGPMNQTPSGTPGLGAVGGKTLLGS